MVSDESLVSRAKQGDKEAWGEIYQAHVDRVYRYVASKVGRGMEAEDLSEQVFIKAIQSLHSFKWQDKPLLAWLLSIAHNLVVDHWRKRATQERFLASQNPGALETNNEDDPERLTERKLQMEDVRYCMSRLTPAQREVISLRFAAELSLEETAQTMKRSVGAVKALQHSALLALRKALQEDGKF